MNPANRILGLAALLCLPLAFASPFLNDDRAQTAPPRQLVSAPEFTSTSPADWINSPPLTLADLKGHVLLLDVWTFGCWNCYWSFPWLTDLKTRLGHKGLKVIGIHSPEFAHERDGAAVRAKARDFGLTHPILLDNDFRYWKALNNRYWPAYYLIDREGRIRERFIGEIHKGSGQAKEIEGAVEKLLVESGAGGQLN